MSARRKRTAIDFAAGVLKIEDPTLKYLLSIDPDLLGRLVEIMITLQDLRVGDPDLEEDDAPEDDDPAEAGHASEGTIAPMHWREEDRGTHIQMIPELRLPPPGK